MDSFRVAAKAFIINQKGEVLLIKRGEDNPHKPGVWEIPGGRLETGESPFDGLKREVAEETGLDVQVLNPLKVHHFTRDDGQKITMVVFICKSASDEVRLSKEHVAHIWMDTELAKLKMVPDFHEEIDIYNKLFKGKK
ncbi:MAG TPA: NUDIX domain-containing protein [Candidatus Acidoferrales bacterium]|nr:NUDIX domain-containing protein [Candidatus Acidoferrales bacterium]